MNPNVNNANDQAHRPVGEETPSLNETKELPDSLASGRKTTGSVQRLVRCVSEVCGLDFFRIGCDLSAIDESNAKVMSIKRLREELADWSDDTNVWFDYIFLKDSKSSY